MNSIEEYFAMTASTVSNIKTYLEQLYTFENINDRKSGSSYDSHVISVTKKEYEEKTTFVVKYYITRNKHKFKEGSLEIDIKTASGLFGDSKNKITIAQLKSPITTYAKGISANKIYINIADNEVTIGNLLRIKDIEFAKKLLTSRKITDDEVKQYIVLANFYKRDSDKTAYVKDQNEERLKELGKASPENVLNEIKQIKVDKRVFDKMRILLKQENMPERLNGEFIDNLLKIYENKLNKTTPMDIEFTELETKLLRGLRHENRRKTMKQALTSNLSQKGDLSAAVVNTQIKKILSGINKDALSGDIQQLQDTTPLSSAIQSSKIYFLDNKTNEKALMSMDNMMGIIDPVHTHEAKANLDNKLTNAVKIVNSEMMIKVYNKKFTEVYLTVGEYMTTPIMAYEHIDYRRKEIKRNPEDAYNCYLYGEYVVRKLKDIEYLRHMDSMVSKSTQMIPFLNKTYVGRGMYGAIQLGQAVPTQGCDKTIISTGNDTKLYNETMSHIIAPSDGKVIDYRDGIAVIQDNNGKRHNVEVEEFKETMNHSFNKYIHNFRVGQQVSKGDIMFYMNTFKKDGSLALTTPALVMLGTYYSMENNDSSVVSESFAKKLMCEEQDIIDIPLKKDKFKFKINEFTQNVFEKIGLPKVGSIVRHNEELFSLGVIPDTDEAKIYEKLRKQPLIKTKTYYVPFEIYEGTITKIEVINNTEKEYAGEYTKELQDLDRECFKIKRELDKNFKPNRSEFEDNKNVDYIIRIYIKFLRNLTVGAKLSLLNGNKSTISNILPDDKMPKLQDGRIVDVIISPLSEVPRMLGSEPYLLYLGKLAFHLYDRLAKNKVTQGVLQALEMLFPNETKIEPQKILKKYGNNGYLRFTFMPYDTELNMDYINKLFELCHIKQKEDKVYDPIGKNYIRGAVDVGYLDIMLLHIMAAKKFKVTPTVLYTNTTQGYGSLRKIKDVANNKYENTAETGQSLSETRIALEGHGATEEFKSMLRARNIDPSIDIGASFDQLLIRLQTS